MKRPYFGILFIISITAIYFTADYFFWIRNCSRKNTIVYRNLAFNCLLCGTILYEIPQRII